MNAHIFNIDNLLINIDRKVWIIEKNNPSEYLMRINKEDFDLIKTGVFKDDDLSMNFNGKTYWLSKRVFDNLKKVVKKLGNSNELSFSFREYTDPETIQGMKVDYDLTPIKHLKNTNDHIYFISTKGSEKKYGNLYTKLVDELRESGLIVKQVYYLNQSYFSQNKDSNIKKICYVLISNLMGRDIEEDGMLEELGRNYNEVHYYDTNYVNIHKIDSQFEGFLSMINNNDDNSNVKDKKIKLNLVGSNKLKPFSVTEIQLGKYIKTYEGFTDNMRRMSHVESPETLIKRHLYNILDVITNANINNEPLDISEKYDFIVNEREYYKFDISNFINKSYGQLFKGQQRYNKYIIEILSEYLKEDIKNFLSKRNFTKRGVVNVNQIDLYISPFLKDPIFSDKKVAGVINKLNDE